MSILKNKHQEPYLVKEVGEWKFTFHYKEGNIKRTFLSITSTSGLFNCRIGGNCHAFGYLLAAATQNRLDQLKGYAVTLYIPAMGMTQDQGLCNDVQKAINKWMKRKETEAKNAAKAVTETEETASQAFMESAIKRSKMSRKEVKKEREELKKVLEDGE